MPKVKRKGDTVDVSPRKASGDRECRVCRVVKPDEEFYRGWRCRVCTHKQNSDRYHRECANSPESRAKYALRSKNYYNRTKPEQLVRTRARNRKIREAVLAAYGGACQCCGESRHEFMAIDHIHGGGRKHKRELGVTVLNRWLLKNGFPAGFQVLCHNCNMAKGMYGECPHAVERRQCAS